MAVAYRRFGLLKAFVQSILNQTADGWTLHVMHDGPDEEFDRIMEAYAREDGRVRYSHTPVRHNDYGHTLRDEGLRAATGDYVLLTNGDNYYIPRAIEYLAGAVRQTDADAVIFDMIHSHERPGGRPQAAYNFFETAYRRLSIDIGAAIVRRELAAAAGFRDKTHDADATYFEDVARVRNGALGIAKIHRVMLVHN